MSPFAWLATIVSLLSLTPLLSAPHPLLGSVAAVVLYTLTMAGGMSVSQPTSLVRWRTRFAAVAVLGGVAVVLALASALHGAGPLSASLVAINPATLVTAVAVAATSIAWLPGRLGPLIHREQRSVTSVLDLWMGALLVLAAAGLSISASMSSAFRQTIYVIVCAMNANLTLNCLGLDRPAGLTRYLILPIRGRDLLLAKNAAVMVIVALQLILLLAWQSGVKQLGAEIVVAVVLILAHLAWGHVVSVFEPRRAEPHRLTAPGDPLTALASLLIGSTPGVAVVVLLRSDSRAAAFAIAAIFLFTAAAYCGSLRFAGRSFERRVEIISSRLA